jgi:DNA-binding protein HU-beta
MQRMFRGLVASEFTDLAPAVHYVVRCLSHGKRPGHQAAAGDLSKRQFDLAKRMIGEIEAKAGSRIDKMNPAQIATYVGQLSNIAIATAREDLKFDKEQGQQMLETLRLSDNVTARLVGPVEQRIPKLTPEGRTPARHGGVVPPVGRTSAIPAEARRMGKSELFAHFANRFAVGRTQAREFFGELIMFAQKELKRNGEFVLPGMVRLVVQKRKARMGRNPATGAATKISAKTVVKARIAKQLKDAVLPRK